MSKDILDLEDVLERVQDDRDLLWELVDIFQTDYIKKRKELDKYIAQNNIDMVRDIAHSMKGASGNISAKAIFRTCAKIEQDAENHVLKDLESDLKTLDEQFAQLSAFVEELQKDI